MPPPLRQREGRTAPSKAVLTSAGDDNCSDDEYDSDGGEHFSDGGAEIRNFDIQCLWLVQK